MSTEQYKERKLWLTEAFVEELTSSANWTERTSTDIDVFVRKLELLNALGLSHFWSVERIFQYAFHGEPVESVSLMPIVDTLYSIHHRFIGKLNVADEDGEKLIQEYTARAMGASVSVKIPERLNASILKKEMLYAMSVDTAAKEAPARVDFIRANLWLGTLHMAIATGVTYDIVNKLKGK